MKITNICDPFCCYFLKFVAPLWSMQEFSPQPGVEPLPPAVEAQSLNHWMTSRSKWLTLISDEKKAKDAQGITGQRRRRMSVDPVCAKASRLKLQSWWISPVSADVLNVFERNHCTLTHIKYSISCLFIWISFKLRCCLFLRACVWTLSIYGCAGSLLLGSGFLWLPWAGAVLCCSTQASCCGGFPNCEHRL